MIYPIIAIIVCTTGLLFSLRAVKGHWLRVVAAIITISAFSFSLHQYENTTEAPQAVTMAPELAEALAAASPFVVKLYCEGVYKTLEENRIKVNPALIRVVNETSAAEFEAITGCAYPKGEL
jgi:hypothetical protein